MRISDWSSDVCSSDLGAISLSEINQYRTGFEDRLSRCGALPIDQHRIFADGVKREKRRGILLTAVHIDLDQIESEAEFLERSEEHTSELQSLMRISYAVFCLKKKKKITGAGHITVTTKTIVENNLRHKTI